ncbi:MAG: transporter substrate-binding protein [Rhodospirillales bacterium]|nr:transporter substrate-binding protein [Rhodospirillales bacterium]
MAFFHVPFRRSAPGTNGGMGNGLATGFLWAGVVAALALIVVYPTVKLFVFSFSSKAGPTFDNYLHAFGRVRYLLALWNSLLYGAATTVVATLLALPLAWGFARIRMPGKSIIRTGLLAAFVTPSYLGAVAWILLAGPNAGWINRAWMFLSGAEQGPFNIYSFSGIVFISALYAIPYIFIYVSDGLGAVSSEMEDAARMLGAGTIRVALTVTLPLVAPAIFNGCLIVFLDTIALFGTPAVLGLPAHFNVAAVQLLEFFEYPVHPEAAAAYSLPLIAITCLALWLQRVLRGRRTYVTVTGRTSAHVGAAPAVVRWGLFAYGMVILALAVVLPLACLAKAAFSVAWGRPLSLENLTIGNFTDLLATNDARLAITNSLVIAALAATAAMALGICAAYAVVRRTFPMSGALGPISVGTLAIPGITLGIGFYSAFSAAPFSLYGTTTIIVLAFTVRFLPIAYGSCASGLAAISAQLEEAVRSLGGSQATSFRHVVAPLLRKHLLSGWVLVFIPAIRELSVVIFLAGPASRTISMLLLDYSEGGNLELTAALGLILLAITLVLVVAGQSLLGRDLLSRS